MKYDLFIEEMNTKYILSVYANENTYRWESGGAAGSDWSEKKWYSGIIKIKKIGHVQPEFYSFKSFEVRDVELSELNFENLFSVRKDCLSEVCEKINFNAVAQLKQPFSFIEINRNFVETEENSSGYKAQINAIQNYGKAD